MKEWERKGHFCLCDTYVGGGANREAEVSMSEKNQELLNGGVEGVHLDWSEKRKKVQIDWTGRSHGIGEQAGLDRSSTPPQILVAASTVALSLSLSLFLSLRASPPPVPMWPRCPLFLARHLFSHAHLPNCLCGTRLVEKRRHIRLVDDSGGHAHEVPSD